MSTLRPVDSQDSARADGNIPATPDAGAFAVPGKPASDYTDGRTAGEWATKYPPEARRGINREACVLALTMVSLCIAAAFLLGMSGQVVTVPFSAFGLSSVTWTVDFRLPTLFVVGCLGGTTFSIKWLIHSVAKSKWHLDRRYWRMFVPLIGGVYACVVLTLFDSGAFGSGAGQVRSFATTSAYAFLIGYFSDGVSGLLSNIANAVFGTLEKK